MFLVGQLKILYVLKRDGQVPRSGFHSLKRFIIPGHVCVKESTIALHVSMCSHVPVCLLV